MRLLIVEDETDLAAALRVGLRREGYAVDVVADGASALERASYTPYDVVCLDVGLPDMDGVTVCRELRAQARPDDEPPPRVLMLTARTALERSRGRPRRRRRRLSREAVQLHASWPPASAPCNGGTRSTRER